MTRNPTAYPQSHTRRTRKIVGWAAALSLGLLGTELYGAHENQTFAEPANSCVSPFKTSETYVDSATSDFQLYTGILATGVVAKVTVPKGAYGAEIGFKGPHDSNQQWTTSNMLKPNSTGEVDAKLAIGDGQTQFGVRIVAAKGSKLCHETPPATFDHKGITEFPLAEGQLPWATAGNQPANAPAQLIHMFENAL